MKQNEKVISYLKSGKSINAKQALGLFAVKNLRARVQDLRKQGYAIYTNVKNGVASYRLGAPSREIVSIAYRIAGPRFFK
jgi:hypothetical protein